MTESTPHQMLRPRETKYCNAIRVYMATAGHATNADIHAHIRERFPTVSATTIHRATARLAERGDLGVAPSDKQGAMRYDDNTTLHDHFMCERCDMVRDAHLSAELKPIIERKIGEGCAISGSLTVTGLCKKCHKEGI